MPVFFSLSSFLEIILFIEVMLICLVTMVEREKMVFWLYNAVGGLFVFGGVLLKQGRAL